MAGETVEQLVERLYRVHKVMPMPTGRRRLYRGRVERIDVPVWADTGETLRLRGSRGRDGMLQFSLVFGRRQVIRKWHSHEEHYNPGGELVDGPHKHYPTDRYPQAQYAYSTGEKIPVDDFEEALFAFLDECRIELIEPL